MALFQSRHSPAVTLSPEDILTIDNRIRRDYSSSFSSRPAGKSPQRRLSPRDMLSISEEISREYAVHKLQRPVQSKSEIVLLPVDPDHLHAYWHLDENQRPQDENQSLILRIRRLPEEINKTEPSQNWFDLAIEPGLSQHKLSVPETMAANYYSAELGWLRNEAHFEVLASSDTTFMPRTADAGRVAPPARRMKTHTSSGLGRLAL